MSEVRLPLPLSNPGARASKSDSSGSNTYLRASSGLIGSIVSDSGATYTPGVSEKRGTTSTFYHADIKNSVEHPIDGGTRGTKAPHGKVK